MSRRTQSRDPEMRLSLARSAPTSPRSAVRRLATTTTTKACAVKEKRSRGQSKPRRAPRLSSTARPPHPKHLRTTTLCTDAPLYLSPEEVRQARARLALLSASFRRALFSFCTAFESEHLIGSDAL